MTSFAQNVIGVRSGAKETLTTLQKALEATFEG